MSIIKEESPQLLFFFNRVIWISSIFIFAGIPLIINPTALKKVLNLKKPAS